MAADTLVVVLCRPPASSESKTRLVADVGAAAARDAYERCLRHALRTAAAATARVRVSVAGRPLELADLTATCAPEAELVRQHDGPFARRQAEEIRRGLADGYRRVAFMASDLPTVRPEEIDWTLSAPDGRVRIAPSQDGGYAILGTGVELPELVSTPMSRGDTRQLLVTAVRHSGRRVDVAPFEVANINHGPDLRYLTGIGGRA
ncbi:DUF2064 domain-containing protein [Streptosporangium sandarakinum]|uniref:DUF2064 domain-containing protein n=1 Tax=Streptosporangium TaxID=2000 RepID=UPI0031F84568